MDKSYFGRWIVKLDGYNLIVSKKTEFYGRLREKQANLAEMNAGFF